MFKTSSKVVYTAIFGGKDELKPIPESVFESDVDFVYFNHNVKLTEDIPTDDPVRTAKYFKVLPHRVLPDAKYSLWMDGNVMLKVPLSQLILKYLGGSDIVFFKHPLRDCAYNEADACIINGLDDPQIIKNQMLRYEADGFPHHYGLTACTVILRRHTPEVLRFNEMWWDEICKGSRRDQLSVDYCLRKSGLSYVCNYFDGFVQGRDRHPAFEGSEEFSYFPHLK